MAGRGTGLVVFVGAGRLGSDLGRDRSRRVEDREQSGRERRSTGGRRVGSSAAGCERNGVVGPRPRHGTRKRKETLRAHPSSSAFVSHQSREDEMWMHAGQRGRERERERRIDRKAHIEGRCARGCATDRSRQSHLSTHPDRPSVAVLTREERAGILGSKEADLLADSQRTRPSTRRREWPECATRRGEEGERREWTSALIQPPHRFAQHVNRIRRGFFQQGEPSGVRLCLPAVAIQAENVWATELNGR